jgi:hypothetical protein
MHCAPLVRLQPNLTVRRGAGNIGRTGSNGPVTPTGVSSPVTFRPRTC